MTYPSKYYRDQVKSEKGLLYTEKCQMTIAEKYELCEMRRNKRWKKQITYGRKE